MSTKWRTLWRVTVLTCLFAPAALSGQSQEVEAEPEKTLQDWANVFSTIDG
jgi:hypothetical protein